MIKGTDCSDISTHRNGVAEVGRIYLIRCLKNLLLRPICTIVPEHVGLAAINAAGCMLFSSDHKDVSIDGRGAAKVSVIHLVGSLKDLLLYPSRAVVSINVSLAASQSA